MDTWVKAIYGIYPVCEEMFWWNEKSDSISSDREEC